MIPRHCFVDLNEVALSLTLGGFRADVLNWGFLEPRWWRNYLHRHSFFEICYVFAGRGTFRCLAIDYAVQAGDLFVAKPGEPHEIISSDDDPLGIYFWSYTLVPPTARDVAVTGTGALLHAFLASRRWVSDRTESLRVTLDLLTEEIAQKQPGHCLAIEGLVGKLLLDTARAVADGTIPAEGGPPVARDPVDALAQRIVAYLRDNYNRPISVREVAAQVHLSERHTSRLFREATGVSILSFVTTLRLQAAAQLLLDPRLAIHAVALAVGYPDVRYFTTLFHRHMGETPRRFRLTGGTTVLARGA